MKTKVIVVVLAATAICTVTTIGIIAFAADKHPGESGYNYVDENGKRPVKAGYNYKE